jgi:uracil-DNA glycosylase
VLLLNATLTVRDAQAKSHHGKGWERLTDAILSLVVEKRDPVVFLLWGQSAKDKLQRLPELSKHPYHLLLTAPHPSPLSAYHGFLGCGHFSKTNAFLEAHGQTPIDWRI